MVLIQTPWACGSSTPARGQPFVGGLRPCCLIASHQPRRPALHLDTLFVHELTPKLGLGSLTPDVSVAPRLCWTCHAMCYRGVEGAAARCPGYLVEPHEGDSTNSGAWVLEPTVKHVQPQHATACRSTRFLELHIGVLKHAAAYCSTKNDQIDYCGTGDKSWISQDLKQRL